MANPRIGDLQTAYVQQLTVEGQKKEWVVYNTWKHVIAKFPKEWDEKTIMSVIHFARKYELLAFNAGVEHRRSQEKGLLKSTQELLVNEQNSNKIIVDRNEELANHIDELNKQLDQLTINN